MNTAELDKAVERVRQGVSLRQALREVGLPATKRMQLSRRLSELGVPYAWRGKGRHDDTPRMAALAVLGHPKPGDVGYWRRLASLVSAETNVAVSAETIQLWYGRRFGPAYVRKTRQ